MTAANEFPRPVRLDSLGEAPRALAVEATEAERAALARRFGLVSIGRLEAEATLRRAGDAVHAEGRMRADVVQSCSATGEPIPATLDEPFALRFEPDASDTADEIELGAEDLDIVSYSGGVVDLGEAIADTLSLSLDPFPRLPDADARLREAGVLEEGDVGPFAALKALKDKLK